MIGKKFDIELLFALCPDSEQEIIGIIYNAVELQLLERDPVEKEKNLFTHDRIKEAFYSSIDPSTRVELHYRIALVIEKNFKNDPTFLYDLVYHFSGAEDNNKLLLYSYRAACYAKENYANEEAIINYTKVLTLLDNEQGRKQPEWINSKQNLAEVYITTGECDKGIVLLNEVLLSTKKKTDKARIYEEICKAYYRKGDYARCEEYGILALRLLGVKIPLKKITIIFSIAKELLIHFIFSFLPGYFFRKKVDEKKKEKYKTIFNVYLILSCAYGLSDTIKFVNSVLLLLNISQKYLGKSNELAISISGYAVLLMFIPFFNKALKYHKKSINLNKEINNKFGQASSVRFLGFCYEFMGDYKKAIVHLQQATDLFREIGDIKEYATTLLGLIESNTYLARYPLAKKFNLEHKKIAVSTRDFYSISANLINSAIVEMEKGNFKVADQNLKECKNIEHLHSWSMLCYKNTFSGKLYMETGQLQKALDFLLMAKKLEKEHGAIQHYIANHNTLIAEVYLREYHLIQNDNWDSTTVEHRAQDNQNKRMRLVLLKKIKKACKVAIAKTRNWKTHYGGALRVMAGYHILAGRQKKAEIFFLKSLEICEKTGRRFEHARTLFEYGIFLQKNSRNKEAKKNWEMSYKIFDEIKSAVYKKRVAEYLGIQEEQRTSVQRLQEKQRLGTVIKVTQDISSILELKALLKNVLIKAIEVKQKRPARQKVISLQK